MTPSKHLYELFLLSGPCIAIFLYAFHFDDLSETELVRLSYVWIGVFVFGAHGLMATEIRQVQAATEGLTFREARIQWLHAENRSLLSRLATVLLWSLLLTRRLVGDQPLGNALMGLALWIAALGLFFEGIFPAL